MTLQEALERYLSELADKGYSAVELLAKGCLLRRWLSCALALYDPTVPRRLESVRELVFYGQARIYTSATPNKRRAVEHFLEAFRDEQRAARQANVAVFLNGYESRFLDQRSDREERMKAILSFCRAVGFSVSIEGITEGVHRQLMQYLRAEGPRRAPTYAQAFLLYCYEQGSMGFNPHHKRRLPYEQALEEGFLSRQSGMWTEHLRAYLSHLKSERNLSDGGIDFYGRKLRIFAKWLDLQGCKNPQMPVVKGFIEMKEKEGVGRATLSKYVYSIRYFFNFLIDRGLFKNNPAQDLQIKHRRYREPAVLTEPEVKQVIEYLEQEIHRNKGSKEIRGMMQHFRAARDLSLFQLFVFTAIRLSGAAEMKLNDIDFDKRSVGIRQKGNREHRSTERRILLDDEVWKRFTAYLRVRNYPGQEAVWISWSAAPLSIAGINRMIVARVKKAGIEKRISPHRLRATCASVYLKNGMDPFSLKTLMGHQSIATTMQHYTRLNEEELREVWKKTNPLAEMDDE